MAKTYTGSYELTGGNFGVRLTYAAAKENGTWYAWITRVEVKMAHGHVQRQHLRRRLHRWDGLRERERDGHVGRRSGLRHGMGRHGDESAGVQIGHRPELRAVV